MLVEMLRAKLHRATVTDADLHYEGSISIDPKLIEAAGFFINEKVDILDIDNGARFSTYVIKGGEGQICLNGAAARMVQRGDKVIILSYCQIEKELVTEHKPQVILLDENNKIKGKSY